MQMSLGLSPVGAFTMFKDVLLFVVYLYRLYCKSVQRQEITFQRKKKSQNQTIQNLIAELKTFHNSDYILQMYTALCHLIVSFITESQNG